MRFFSRLLSGAFRIAYMAFLCHAALAGNAWAQCWSVAAGADAAATSTQRPRSTEPYEAILLEMEGRLQQAMGVPSRVFLTDNRSVRADPVSRNIYFGKPYFGLLEDRYKSEIKTSQGDPIPAGLKLIIAHEYAHQFQFRMFRKKNITLATSTPVDELQADVLASYFLGSMLDTQYSSLPQKEKEQKVMHESSGAVYVVAQLGDFFFNDKNHHGDPVTRRYCMSAGLEAGWVHKFGTMAQALTTNEDQIYDWSRKVAEDNFKQQINGPVFSRTELARGQ